MRWPMRLIQAWCSGMICPPLKLVASRRSCASWRWPNRNASRWHRISSWRSIFTSRRPMPSSRGSSITKADAHAKDGKLRAIAVTSSERNTMDRDIPAIAEAGIAGFSAVSWTGVSAPANTPPEDSRKAACLGHRSDPFPGRTRQAGRKRTGDRCNFINGLHGLCRRRSGPVGQGCEGFQHYGGLRLRALGAWRQMVDTSHLIDRRQRSKGNCRVCCQMARLRATGCQRPPAGSYLCCAPNYPNAAIQSGQWFPPALDKQ